MPLGLPPVPAVLPGPAPVAPFSGGVAVTVGAPPLSVVTVRRVSVLMVPHSWGSRWRQPPVTAVQPVGFLKGSLNSFPKGSSEGFLKGSSKGFLNGSLVWRSPWWRRLVFPRFPGCPLEVLPDYLQELAPCLGSPSPAGASCRHLEWDVTSGGRETSRRRGKPRWWDCFRRA